MAPTTAGAGEKRGLEETDASPSAKEQPENKMARTDEGIGAASEEAAPAAGCGKGAGEAQDGPVDEGGESGEPAASAVEGERVKIGYRSVTGAEAQAYYQEILSALRRHQNLNDYERHMVLDLIRRGHPEAERKLAGGVRAIQVRDTEHEGATSKCFFLIHDDGTVEDVSYRKCIFALFPGMEEAMASRDRNSKRSSGAAAARNGPDGSARRGRGGGRGASRGGARGRGARGGRRGRR